MQREKPPEWREKQKGSRGIRRGQRYRLVFQFPIREQRAAEVVVLPLVPAAGLPADGTSATDLAVELNGITYQACRGDFVVRLDGSTCLQLWNKEGRVVCLEGDPLEVAQWLQACHDAGIEVRVQINESSVP
uniref:YdeA n=1 Tax=Escherichia coli TaxID=562 RepID=A0A145Z0G0_ECOLX|nr:ydeA [Escherichia coli]